MDLCHGWARAARQRGLPRSLPSEESLAEPMVSNDPPAYVGGNVTTVTASGSHVTEFSLKSARRDKLEGGGTARDTLSGARLEKRPA